MISVVLVVAICMLYGPWVDVCVVKPGLSLAKIKKQICSHIFVTMNVY
jgi:hypothetical protein